MNDYFEILHISEDADKQTIEAAYRTMLGKYSEGNDPEERRKITEAYRMLANPAVRQACLDFHHMEDRSKRIYWDAETFIDEGNSGEAAKILEKAIKTEKYNDHLYYLMGIACFLNGRFIKAVRAFEKVIMKYPEDLVLIAYYCRACIESRFFKKAVIQAEMAYQQVKSNQTLNFCLVEGYLHTRRYEEAEAVLKSMLDKPEFAEYQFSVCARLIHALYLERRYDESLKFMQKLLSIPTDEQEKTEAGELFLEILDFYMENGMYREALICVGYAMKLLPQREDILEVKKEVEQIVKLDSEFSRFEKDKNVPEALLGLIVNKLFPSESTGMTEEQMKAYEVMNEYYILCDCNIYLMPLRYIKNNYPGLYELKAEFFESIQDTKKRKVLQTRYIALVAQYQDIFSELIDKLSDEYGEDLEDGEENEEDEQDKDGAERDIPVKEARGRQKTGKSEDSSGLPSNVRPFIRKDRRKE